MTDRDDHDEHDDGALAPFFDAARRGVPEPGEAFLTRLADQAAAEFKAARPIRERPPAFRAAVSWFGGLGGLAAAGAAGFWIGFAPPAGWIDPANLVGDVTAAVEYDRLLSATLLDLAAMEEQ